MIAATVAQTRLRSARIAPSARRSVTVPVRNCLSSTFIFLSGRMHTCPRGKPTLACVPAFLPSCVSAEFQGLPRNILTDVAAQMQKSYIVLCIITPFPLLSIGFLHFFRPGTTKGNKRVRSGILRTLNPMQYKFAAYKFALFTVVRVFTRWKQTSRPVPNRRTSSE